MKILAINSSLKKSGGKSEILIDRFLSGAEQAGAESKKIRLAKSNINPCIACSKCQNADGYHCIYEDKDDFESIVSDINDSDIILFSTPVYLFEMSSLLKIFLERIYSHGKSNIRTISDCGLMFHDVDSVLKNKKLVCLIVSDNLEEATIRNVKNYWKTYCKFMDCRLINIIDRTSAFILEDNIQYTAIKKQILENTFNAGQEIVKLGYIRKNTIKAISKRIIPMPFILYRLLMKTEKGRSVILEKLK